VDLSESLRFQTFKARFDFFGILTVGTGLLRLQMTLKSLDPQILI